MPFALIISGIVLLVAGVRNTVTDSDGQTGLTTLVKGDFTGQGSFVYWMLAILAIGSLGYIDSIKPLSRALLVLVVIVLIINNRGVFSQFQQQISQTASTPAATTPATQAVGIA